MGGLTRQRPLGQVGKCENPLDIYSQTSTNVHLSRLTATLRRGTVQTMTLVLTSLQRQRPQKSIRNNQNHISTRPDFSATDEKLKNAGKFDPYGSLVINRLASEYRKNAFFTNSLFIGLICG